MIGEGRVQHDHGQLNPQFNDRVVAIVVAAIRLRSNLQNQVNIFHQQMHIFDAVRKHNQPCDDRTYYLQPDERLIEGGTYEIFIFRTRVCD